MSEIIYTNEKQPKASFEKQAEKENILFSEELSDLLPEELSLETRNEPPSTSACILSIGLSKFAVQPTHLERINLDLFIELQIYNFDILNFINFETVEIEISGKSKSCKLVSYSCPKEEAEYGLIKILLMGGA